MNDTTTSKVPRSESPAKKSEAAFEAHRAKVRQEAVDEIPSWYSPLGHLLATVGIGAGTVALALSKLSNVTALEAILVPAAGFVIANGFEWRVHKKILHKRVWPFAELFDRHTPLHHVVFVEDDMALRATKELRLVLIPAIGVLGSVVGSIPGAVLAGKLFGANAGWLMLATSGAYMATYELSHLAYHLPEDHPIGGNPLIRFMRKHHAAHHDPKNMQRYNFNVTLPLFDWIMGTMAPEATEPTSSVRTDRDEDEALANAAE